MNERLLFMGTPEDEPYIHQLKPLVGNFAVTISYKTPESLFQVEKICEAKMITKVLITNTSILAKLVGLEDKKPTINNYAGSYFLKNGIEYVVINPLKQLTTVNYMEFLTRRYVSKLTAPSTWFEIPDFNFEILTLGNIEDAFNFLDNSIIVGVDIETVKENLAIRCIGFTGISYDSSGNLESRSYVLGIEELWAVEWMRKLCWEVRAPKGFQNGLYDISYLTRYNCPVYNYLYDTAAMHHCSFSELPKDLSTLAAFYLHRAKYWKQLSESTDKYNYYRYNAIDTYYTAWIIVVWLLEAPAYAKKNYEDEFPLVFPSHLAAMTGIPQDQKRLVEQRRVIQARIDSNYKKLRKLISEPHFNVNSPIQMKKLQQVFGVKNPDSSDEKALEKLRALHPIMDLIFGIVLDIRGDLKLLSTYLVEDKAYRGVILYSLIPWGTDTGRNASKESSFWCGMQLQNIPSGYEVKCTLTSYPGFLWAEVDSEQAESRDTAYISGDENLIAAVEGSRDFHSVNASAFFGIPYEEIYNDHDYYEADKFFPRGVINKEIRNLAKRTNHGANYNMAAFMMVQTMGLRNVWRAQTILKLPKNWKPEQVTGYLLEQFHKTYSTIKKVYYPKVINDVKTTGLLVGPTGWTRRCFGKPWESKLDLNAYVAHPSQSANAMRLNKAFMRVFYEIAMHPLHGKNFYLLGQIHDSIPHFFKEGHEYLSKRVAEIMTITLEVTGADGKHRKYTVPAAIKAGKDGKGVKYWNETE